MFEGYITLPTLPGTAWYTYGMSKEENEEPASRGGRAKTELGTAPKRNIRVHDPIWTASQTAADALGISISEYVRRALVDMVATGRWKALTSQVGRAK